MLFVFITGNECKTPLRVACNCHMRRETKLQPRFDVVEVYAPDGEATKMPLINHLEDAFQ